MKILLVQAPFSSRCSGLDRFYVTEPLALETVGASVPHHEVRLLDMRIDPDLDRALKEFSPAMVATTSYTPEVYRASDVLRRAKAFDPRIVTVVGGHHATLLPQDFNRRYIDTVVIGEGDVTFRELADTVERGGSLAGVKGLALRQKDGGFHFTPPREMVEDLDTIPVPARTLTRAYREHYFRLAWRPVATLLTSRGCPFRCNFCSVWKHEHGKYRMRSAAAVVKELQGIAERFVSVSDDNFLQDSRRAAQLAHMIKANGIDKVYKVIGRSDSVVRHPEIIEQWKEIGLTEVTMGLESFRDDELAALNKHNTGKTNEEAIRILKDLGVSVTTHFIIRPDYTREDFLALEEYVQRLGLYHPVYAVLTPLPMTDLYRESRSQLLTDNYEMFDLLHSVVPTKLPRREFYRYYAELFYRSYVGRTKDREEDRFFKDMIGGFCRYIEGAHTLDERPAMVDEMQ